MKHKLLIVDGLYFANRVLGQLNMNDLENNLITEQEQELFSKSLNNSLVNLWKVFNNRDLITNIVFTCDYSSWRKNEEPFIPYFLKGDTETPTKYKEQRKKKKDESPIDYDKFYELTNNFIKSLEGFIPVFQIENMEADDCISLISKKLKAYKDDVLGILYATDGDLIQTVHDNFIYFKNVRSKVAPNGEFVISSNTYNKIFENSMVDKLLGSQLDNKFYTDLFSINSLDIEGKNTVVRKINQGIKVAQPWKLVFEKSIVGDPKDNIFSLLSWKSSTGTRTYKLTEKKLVSSMAKLGDEHLSENCAKKYMGNKELLQNLLLQLRDDNKQTGLVKVEDMANHLRHNFKMNILSEKNIPDNLIEEFENRWNNQKSLIFENLDTVELLKKESAVNHSKKSGFAVMSEGIPEL